MKISKPMLKLWSPFKRGELVNIYYANNCGDSFEKMRWGGLVNGVIWLWRGGRCGRHLIPDKCEYFVKTPTLPSVKVDICCDERLPR